MERHSIDTLFLQVPICRQVGSCTYVFNHDMRSNAMDREQSFRRRAKIRRSICSSIGPNFFHSERNITLDGNLFMFKLTVRSNCEFVPLSWKEIYKNPLPFRVSVSTLRPDSAIGIRSDSHESQWGTKLCNLVLYIAKVDVMCSWIKNRPQHKPQLGNFKDENKLAYLLRCALDILIANGIKNQKLILFGTIKAGAKVRVYYIYKR